MDNPSSIEAYLASILTGSCLPMERRATVAQELREHLESAVQSKLSAGLSEEDATVGALREFGPPRRIRKQLQHQQRELDRRRAFGAAVRLIWLPITLSAPLAVGLAELVPPDGALPRWASGLLVYLYLFAGGTALMFAASLYEIEAKRRRPLSEFCFKGRFLRWTKALTLGLLATLAGVCLLTGGGVWLLRMSPVVELFPWYLFYPSSEGLQEAVGRMLLVGLPGAFGGAAAISLFERSRCIADSADMPVLH